MPLQRVATCAGTVRSAHLVLGAVRCGGGGSLTLQLLFLFGSGVPSLGDERAHGVREPSHLLRALHGCRTQRLDALRNAGRNDVRHPNTGQAARRARVYASRSLCAAPQLRSGRAHAAWQRQPAAHCLSVIGRPCFPRVKRHQPRAADGNAAQPGHGRGPVVPAGLRGRRARRAAAAGRVPEILATQPGQTDASAERTTGPERRTGFSSSKSSSDGASSSLLSSAAAGAAADAARSRWPVSRKFRV